MADEELSPIQQARLERARAWYERQRHSRVSATWKRIEHFGLLALGENWLHLVAGLEYVRPFVYRPNPDHKELVRMWMDRVRREEELSPVERAELRAEREHEAIQSTLEEDKSGGDPDVCYRCGNGGLVVDSRVGPEYSPRHGADVLRCRSWAEPCGCPAGDRFRDGRADEATAKQSRPRGTDGRFQRVGESQDGREDEKPSQRVQELPLGERTPTARGQR